MSTVFVEDNVPSGSLPVPLPQESDLIANDSVLSGALPVPLPQVEPGLRLCFDIPAFQLSLTLPIAEIDPDMESGRVIFKATIDGAILVLTVTGKLNGDEDGGEGGFKIEHIHLHMERAEENARADFIISTIRAVLVLADNVYLRIPEVNIKGTLRFDEPLLNVSQMLRRRQTDYRIMVIERATGYRFQLPLDVSGEQVKNIALIYHAITERSFVWPICEIGYGLPATKDVLSRLLALNQLSSIKFGPHPITITLFDKPVFLGFGYITIEDKIIENFDEVQKELALDDGHMVYVVVQSLSGHGRHDLPEAPHLPDMPWDEKIQGLVDLEERLDEALVARYHALAASTLEGLTEEEKIAITARPELDEQAFQTES